MTSQKFMSFESTLCTYSFELYNKRDRYINGLPFLKEGFYFEKMRFRLSGFCAVTIGYIFLNSGEQMENFTRDE